MNPVQDTSTVIYRVLSKSTVIFTSMFSLILILFSCRQRLIRSIVAMCIYGPVYWVV